LGSLDRPGEQTDPADGSRDRPSGPDRRNRGETEAEAAERLGLSNLTRGDYYDSQRAAAEAQEAAIKRRDAARDQTADEPEQRLEEPRSYWTEVPRFLSMWQRLADRWPQQLSKTPDAASKLAPEQRTSITDAVDKVPAREPPISENIKAIAADNASGAWLEGYEFRLKGSDRLVEKVAEALETSTPDAPPNEIVEQVPDAIRYTFCVQSERYSSCYWEIKERLEASGCEMYHSKDSWKEPEYKGINTRWVSPEGQRFEVQFHTPESFHAKHEVTHAAYERLRNPLTSDGERRELSDFQREVSSWIPVPSGAVEIPDCRRRGS
jgi:hypothetical protein